MQIRSSALLLIAFSCLSSNVGVLGRGALRRRDFEQQQNPIVVNPSQDWDGNDGPWSSFVVQVGQPAQAQRILVSTSAYQTSVIVSEGCIDFSPPNCISSRGGEGHLFNFHQSSTWENNTANVTSNIYPIGVGKALGYHGKAELGFDDVTLGWKGAGGPTLKNQTVAGFASNDSYLGFFGISPRASNFTSMANPIPSYMQNLRQNSMIPSLSWAYTAGNQYRGRIHNLGSLTLGGYDTSRFIDHNVTWAMSEDIRDLTVQIESITMSNNSTTSILLPTAIPALLDSSFPYIWLPLESCLLFEKAFGLTYDTATELYLVSDSLHDALVLQNASVVFTLGNLNGSSVNVTLPYSAFDLTASPPLVANTSRYFPLKRAANNTQYTLGRTFFQEAYVVADYERGNFSVFQCNWARTEEIIVSIPTISPSSNNPLGIEVIGSVGGLVGIVLVAGLIYWCTVGTPHLPRRHAAKEQVTPSSHVDQIWFKPELHNNEIQPAQELVGQRNRWFEEVEANEARIFELPAGEDVAVELRSPDEAIEMAVPPPELESSEDRAKISTKDGRLSLESQEMDSEVSSAVRKTLAREPEPVSPLSPISGESLNSLPAQLSLLTK